MGHQLWTVHCFPPPADAGVSTGRPVARSIRARPSQFDQRLRGEQFSGLGVENVEESVLGHGHGDVALLAVDDQVGDHDVIVFGLQSGSAGLEMPGVFSGLRIHGDNASGKELVSAHFDRGQLAVVDARSGGAENYETGRRDRR